MIISVPPVEDQWLAHKNVVPPCTDGNLLSGAASQIGCTNSLLRSDDKQTRIVGLGLDNVAAIATGDAVLVANLNSRERVKHVFAELKLMHERQASGRRNGAHGDSDGQTLATGPRFDVQRVTLEPSDRLDLPNHAQHVQFWIVVEGVASVTIDGQARTFGEGERVDLAPHLPQRIENRGRTPLTLIKIRIGTGPDEGFADQNQASDAGVDDPLA